MAFKCEATLALGFFLLSLAAMSSASRAIAPSASRAPATITVGGSQHWHFSFNYTDWALKTAPFYQKDTLVFMYDAPNATTFPHSVVLFKNSKSFAACDLKKAKMVANVTQGVGQGFKYVLKNRKPYYFACGERAGFHCNVGLMKFTVKPLKFSRHD